MRYLVVVLILGGCGEVQNTFSVAGKTFTLTSLICEAGSYQFPGRTWQLKFGLTTVENLDNINGCATSFTAPYSSANGAVTIDRFGDVSCQPTTCKQTGISTRPNGDTNSFDLRCPEDLHIKPATHRQTFTVTTAATLSRTFDDPISASTCTETWTTD